MARGGYRCGAGRPGHRLQAEHTMRVDIRIWRKRGLLWDGYAGTWVWSRGEEKVGNIGFRVGAGAIYLDYSMNGSDASQTIWTQTTLCGFGGSRRWFLCPICHSRCELLYMRSGRFACRRCQRISYRTQSGSERDRIIARYHRLNDLVEAGKPKWQHWKTFNRLEARLDEAERLSNESMLEVLERLTGFALD